MNDDEKRRVIDDEHMRLLSRVYLIDGLISTGFVCLLIPYFIFLVAAAADPVGLGPEAREVTGGADPGTVAVLVGLFILLGFVRGIGKVISSAFIRKRRHRGITIAIAMLGFMILPYGAVLAVVTLVLLNRPSIVAQYDRRKSRRRYRSEQAAVGTEA